MEQMATPLLSLLRLARQTMLQVWQDVHTGSWPTPRCPSLPYSPFSLSLHFSPNTTSISFSSSRILRSLPSFQYHLSLLTSSQRSVGYIHRAGEGKSTAAKEKADISVSLRGLSRWLLQQVTASCWQEAWQIKKRWCWCDAFPSQCGKLLKSKGFVTVKHTIFKK